MKGEGPGAGAIAQEQPGDCISDSHNEELKTLCSQPLFLFMYMLTDVFCRCKRGDRLLATCTHLSSNPKCVYVPQISAKKVSGLWCIKLPNIQKSPRVTGIQHSAGVTPCKEHHPPKVAQHWDRCPGAAHQRCCAGARAGELRVSAQLFKLFLLSNCKEFSAVMKDSWT